MILLDGHSLVMKTKFSPETMQLTLSERTSSASMTLGPTAPEVILGDWLQDDTEPGKGTVWRVKTVDLDYNRQTRTVQLEHIICVLKDRIMFGETTTAQLGGGSARAAVQYILNQQSDWILGTFGYNVSNEYSFNGDSLFDALEQIDDTLEDSFWSMDTTVYPFRLSIGRKQDDVDSEMRMSRNITTAKRTIDRSRMYTRFYPIGKDNLTIPGGYVSRNEEIYGTICRVETDAGLDSVAKLTAWANNKIRRHSDPLLTVTVTGLDLSAATGESLDRLRVGRLCRVPLPEYGTVMTEYITKLNYRDKIQQPEVVTVTLANDRDDATTILSRAMNEAAGSPGSRGGRKNAKNNEEKTAWIIDENDHVGLLAVAVAGEGADKDWSRVSSVIADGQGLHMQVKKAQDNIVQCQSNIEMHEDFIDLTTKAIGKDGKITAATIATSVNNAGSNVLISADHIQLTGNTTVGGLLRVNGSDLIVGRNIQTGLGGGYVQTNSVKLVGGSSAQGANVVTLSAGKMATAVQSASVSGNTLTLKLFNGQTINFNRATSLSGYWSGGTFKVTASPQGETFSTVLEQGSTSWGNDAATIPVYAYNSGQQSVRVSTGRNIYLNVRPGSIETRTSGITGKTYLGTATVVNGSYLCFKIGDLEYYITIRVM